MIKKIFLILIISTVLFAQEDNRIKAIGDSLLGKMIDGESVREIHGNVIMTQGAVRITCDKAIQYLARNEADLMGNVVVTQDSIIIKTIHGHYFGNTKVAFSDTGVNLTDGHVQLVSQNGYYFFNEKRSYFYGNVKLKEGVSNLFSSRMNYYDDEDKAVATLNVIVSDTSSTMLTDSLIYYRKTKITNAFSNIRIYNSTDKIAIFGNKLEDDGIKGYTKIWEDPFLVRIDTTDAGKLDTLVTSAKLMEAYDDSTKRLIATDSVKIVRHGFASISNQAIYYRLNDEIQTFKKEGDEIPPIIWNDETQLSGDSIFVFVKNKRLSKINMHSNSTIISAHKDNAFRFDQISGKHVQIFFTNGIIDYTDVTGNALSIYYLYDDNKEQNGLIKSSSDRAKIYFKDSRVTDVKLYIKPASEFHPENLVKGKEKDFTIPSFRMFFNKPTKELLLSTHKNVLTYLEKDFAYYAGKSETTK
jgi:lipopolysaccharide export system protein LptA